MNGIRHSIKFQLILSTILIVLISNFLLSYISYARIKDDITKDKISEIEGRVQEASKLVASVVGGNLRTLTGLSHDSSLFEASKEQRLSILNDQAELLGFDVIALADLKGITFTADKSPISVVEREYFQQALKGKANVSDVINDNYTGKPIMVYAVPAYYQGKIAGVLFGIVEGDHLTDIMDQLSFGDTGYAYVVNREGTNMAHSNRDLVLKQYSPIKDYYENGNKEVRDLVVLLEKVIKNETYSGEYRFRGNDIFAAYAGVEGTSWKIALAMHKEEFYREIDKLKTIMQQLTLLSVICGAAVAYLIAGRLKRALEELDKALTLVAGGDTNVRLKIFSRNEIGRVAGSFNNLLDRLNSLEYYDRVTKLPNYNVLSSELQRVRTHAPREVSYLLMVGIGNISAINENYGFEIGDKVLHMVAERINAKLPMTCDAYKGKGEEIVIVGKIENISYEDAVNKAEDMLSELMQPYRIELFDDVEADINIGLVYIDHALGIDDLNKAAFASRLAKMSGGNRVEIYDAKTYHESRNLRSLEEDLRIAIKKGEFAMAYQPIYAAEDLSLVDAEALIRWNHPTRGLISPDEFIGLAERSDLIIHIDHWVIDEVLRQQRLWKERFTVSINISAKTFEQENFVMLLMDKVASNGLNPFNVQLELTERVVLRNVAVNIEKLNTLRRAGFKIALDDFGVGYSSLSYLVKLPVDTVKIDKSFIQSAIMNKNSRLITTTIVSMCRELGLETIAEGVEDPETVIFLKGLRCSRFQGYYYSKPLLAEKFWEDVILGELE